MNTDTIYGINVFAYCENNPINMSDPSGYIPIWIHIYGNGVMGYTDSATSKNAQKTPLSIVTANEKICARQYEEVLTMVINKCSTMTQDDYDNYSGPSLRANKKIKQKDKDDKDKKTNNCAFYSSLRYYQMSGRVFSGDWYDSTRTSQKPKAGSIAYFGIEGNSHYVFVEYVYGNIIVFSEANWNQNNDFKYQMLTTDEFINRGNKPFQGFLY